MIMAGNNGASVVNECIDSMKPITSDALVIPAAKGRESRPVVMDPGPPP
jgi:hypothetical protein